MRVLATLPAFGVGMLLAASDPMIPPGVAGLLQGGALAVLAWVVWYMLAKAFPAHNKALKDQREDFLEALKEDRKQFYESVNKKRS